VDEPHFLLLRVYDISLYAVRLFPQTRPSRPRNLVWHCLDWLIYGAGAFGFWKMRSWMWPWAAVYSAQVVIAMFVWNIINENGRGLLGGLIAAAIFAVPTFLLWRAKHLFPKENQQ